MASCPDGVDTILFLFSKQPEFMKTIVFFTVILVLFTSCDSSDTLAPPPPERSLSLDSPGARDTLVVGQPFTISGSISVDAEIIQLEVLSESTIFLSTELENPERLSPITIDDEFTIETSTGQTSPIEVRLRFSWNEGDRFTSIPLYLR